MDGNQIRQVFQAFFADRGHTIVPSASLIPVDPTLLLTAAGMVPFKSYLLREEEPPFPRAVSVQKCIRTVDIDIIGTTARHLSFFEMLGNFSFGDYFKEKAIPWAFEFVTEGFGLDPERLWMTVHETDAEAEEIWIDGVGVNPDRVQRRGNDNFWQMGTAGPCGLASEIFYDKGPAFGPDGGPVVDEERFMEFWNLVFMQHIQDEPYHVVGDLPAKNIDTGAGLERVAVVLQQSKSIFHTDLIRPIVAAGEGATGVSFGASERTDVSLRILADHGRAVTFLIGDGVVASNEGRGYVLRRLLRRAVRHGVQLGAGDLIATRLVAATVDVMGDAYPGLRERHDRIAEMAEREEVAFRRTLEAGQQLLDQELADLEEGESLSGATAFKLHDTYGFPIEITEEILDERGLSLDRGEFDTQMEAQRERARAAFKGGKDAEATEAYRVLLRGIQGTDFTGYDGERGTGRVLTLLRDGEPIERADKGQDVELFLDRTPFYAESGGQVGDSGVVSTETGTIEISDTHFALPGVHGHRGKVSAGHVQVGQDADATISRDRRERIRKNHTGTHLLHWGLRDVLGDHVQQAGSLVAPDRLRFDFSHFAAVAYQEVRDVERAVNERIIENAGVTTVVTSKDAAEEMGAIAFFGDKYGDMVRVVKAGDYSTEFCGGTHVPSTGQVGPLLLVSEGSVAANTRRVEAVTGTAAYSFLAGLRREMDEATTILRGQPGRLLDAARSATARLREHEKRIEEFEAQAEAAAVGTLLDQVEAHGSSSLLIAVREDVAPDALRAMAIRVRDRIGSGIGVLGSSPEGKGVLVGFVSKDLVASGVSAGKIIAGAAAILGGGGSRDAELAQAGGPNGGELEAALAEARKMAQASLQGA